MFDVRFVSRAAFLRGERGATCRLAAESFCDVETHGLRATVELAKDGRVLSCVSVEIGTVAPGGIVTFELPVETRMKPGWRDMRVKLSGLDPSGREVTAEKTLRTGIGPLHAPRMTALIQDSNDDVENAAAMGFTDGQYGDSSDFTVKNDLSLTNRYLQAFGQSLDCLLYTSPSPRD